MATPPKTAAHRPGGKFAAMMAANNTAPSKPAEETTKEATTSSNSTSTTAPVAQPVQSAQPPQPAQPRGKFMSPPDQNQKQQPHSKNLSAMGNSNSNTTNEEDLRKQKSSELQLKRQKREEKQRKILSELDEAEDLVLDLLEIASNTTDTLAEMTICKNISDHTETLKSNQESYLSKLKKIHGLLAPYSHLVVAYNDKEQSEEEQNTKEVIIIDEPKQYNMYAARVEKRLALERRDVMKMFLINENVRNSEKEKHIDKKPKLDEDSKKLEL